MTPRRQFTVEPQVGSSPDLSYAAEHLATKAFVAGAVLHDALTLTAAANLTTRTPELGGAWSKISPATGDLVGATGGLSVRPDGAGLAFYANAAVVTSPNVRLVGRMQRTADPSGVDDVYGSVLVRRQAGAATFYEACWGYVAGVQLVTIVQVIAGAATILAVSAPLAIAQDTEVDLALLAVNVGDQVLLTATIDGALVCAASDTAILTAGSFGLGATVDNVADEAVIEFMRVDGYQAVVPVTPHVHTLGEIEGGLRTVSISLTNAEMLALPTTPIPLIAAPGAGLQIVPYKVTLKTVIAGAVTNIDAGAELQIRHATSGAGCGVADLEEAESELTDNLANVATNKITFGAANSGGVVADFDNRALVILADNVAAGVFTGGNAGNSMVVMVEYTVVAT